MIEVSICLLLLYIMLPSVYFYTVIYHLTYPATTPFWSRFFSSIIWKYSMWHNSSVNIRNLLCVGSSMSLTSHLAPVWWIFVLCFSFCLKITSHCVKTCLAESTNNLQSPNPPYPFLTSSTSYSSHPDQNILLLWLMFTPFVFLPCLPVWSSLFCSFLIFFLSPTPTSLTTEWGSQQFHSFPPTAPPLLSFFR